VVRWWTRSSTLRRVRSWKSIAAAVAGSTPGGTKFPKSWVNAWRGLTSAGTGTTRPVLSFL